MAAFCVKWLLKERPIRVSYSPENLSAEEKRHINKFYAYANERFSLFFTATTFNTQLQQYNKEHKEEPVDKFAFKCGESDKLIEILKDETFSEYHFAQYLEAVVPEVFLEEDEDMGF